MWSVYFEVFVLIKQRTFCYFQANSPESIKENQALWSSDIQNCVSSPSGSVYPCTSTVNPTIVLLHHNRGEHACLLHALVHPTFMLLCDPLALSCSVSHMMSHFCFTVQSHFTVLVLLFLSPQSNKSIFLIFKVCAGVLVISICNLFFISAVVVLLQRNICFYSTEASVTLPLPWHSRLNATCLMKWMSHVLCVNVLENIWNIYLVTRMSQAIQKHQGYELCYVYLSFIF